MNEQERLKLKNKLWDIIGSHPSLDHQLHLMDDVKELFEEIDKLEKSKELFLEEFKFEYIAQISNAKGGGQWHTGALRGFEHSKEIFDKHFKL